MAIDNNGYWPYSVKPGDVLRGKNGDFRVVRTVTQGKSGLTIWLSLTIKRRSWTGRCYTTLSYVDLAQRGYVPVPGVRVKLHTELDAKIAHCLAYENRFPKNQILSANSVRGIA